MTETLAEPASATPAAANEARLSGARPGFRGVITRVEARDHAGDHGVDVAELERRLLEFGFVEGAHVEVLHEGAIGRDPIAVRLDEMRIALRRRDADDVWVRQDAE